VSCYDSSWKLRNDFLSLFLALFFSPPLSPPPSPFAPQQLQAMSEQGKEAPQAIQQQSEQGVDKGTAPSSPRQSQQASYSAPFLSPS